MTPTSTVHEADENQSPSSMMAWRVHAFGPPDVMKFERPVNCAGRASMPIREIRIKAVGILGRCELRDQSKTNKCPQCEKLSQHQHPPGVWMIARTKARRSSAHHIILY